LLLFAFIKKMMTNFVKFLLLLSWLLVVLPTTVSSFAAKKKKGGGKKPARTNKGFGAPPPTLDDVLGKFRVRMPEDADNQNCPCNTNPGSLYKDCCGPLHRREQLCTTMSDVLKSRYSAFSWRIVGHVIRTTHETCRDYREDRVAWANDLHKGGMFDSFEFVNLEAGPEEEGSHENEGFINFKVTLRAKEDTVTTLAGQETVVSERSKFLRNPEDGSWTYASGEVRSDVKGLEDVPLNA
jgi:SEC-C motif-containing protein